MSWIKDVRDEIAGLDLSPKSLRKFALLVGGVFILISLWFFFRHQWEVSGLVFLAVGSLLVLTGFIFPHVLKGIYKAWMGVAFAIGWVVSRIVLAILFYVVVTPAGFIARLTGKNFLDLNFREKKSSYWIPRKHDKQDNYEKMY